ncbi:MAG: hypothetical protein ACUVTX_10885 [Bacteroidales bacterium]
MKIILASALILLFARTIQASGQLAAGYNTDGNTLSLSTSLYHKLWGELRVNTKSYNQSPWLYSDLGITQAYIFTRILNT